jgi:isoquinoline 1-oxidoreductase subunit beta
MQYHHLMQRAGLALATHDVPDSPQGLPRRQFLKLSAASGFALGVFPGQAQAQAPATAPTGLKAGEQPAAFIRIDAQGLVMVQGNRLEFGQGTLTGLAMLVAEELDADWTKVRVEHAPAGEAYKDLGFGLQMTGGSTALANSYLQYRELGARTRAMLVAAAAQRFKRPESDFRVANGVVSAGSQRAGFGELAVAAMQLPVPDKVVLKDAREFKRIGQPTGRLDAVAKSTGRQNFGIDARAPGMKTVLLVHPPVFGAQLKRFELPDQGSGRNAVVAMKVTLDRGATGVAVIGEGYWRTKQARDALRLEWDSTGVEKVDTERQLAAYQALAAQPGKPVRPADTSKIATAPKRITAEFSFPYLAHAPMEPLNCLIELNAAGCKLQVGSQFQTIDQATVAGVLGLKPEQVQLTTLMAGGGFGRRAVPSSDYLVEAAHVAKAWKAAGHSEPLKVVWSREDDIRGGYYRPMHVHRVDIGHDEQGQVLGWQHRIVGQSIITGTPFEAFMVKDGVDATMTEGVVDTPYALPIHLEVHHPKVNVPVLWWRSVGHTHTAYVMETLVDEIARSVGRDPVAYRRSLLGDKHPRVLAALNLAVAQSGYGVKTLPAGQAWGVAVHESFKSVVAYVVEASIKDGQPVLHKVTAGVHCNTAVNPMSIEAQVQGAALMGLGTTLPGAAITLKDGVVQQSNFGDYTVARLPQMPVVAVHIVPSTEPPTGMGEPGLPPLAPALANAISRLTGKPLRSLPFAMV